MGLGCLCQINVELAFDEEGTLKVDVAGVCLLELAIFGLAIDDSVQQHKNGPVVVVKVL